MKILERYLNKKDLIECEKIENNGIRKRKKQKTETEMEIERGRARGGKRVLLPRECSRNVFQMYPIVFQRNGNMTRYVEEGKCRFKSLGNKGMKI